SYCTVYIASVGRSGLACERCGNMLVGPTTLLTSCTSTGLIVGSAAVGPRGAKGRPTPKFGQKSPATGGQGEIGGARVRDGVPPDTPVKLVGVMPVYANAFVPPRNAVPDAGKPAVLVTGIVVAPAASVVPTATSSRVARTGAVVSG